MPTTAGQRAASKPPTRSHVWVDGELPGVLVSWSKADAGVWVALVAYVMDGKLVVEEMPAARVQPAGM